VQPVETKWHGDVSDVIIMPNVTLELPQMLADGGQRGWRFTGASLCSYIGDFRN
jgi:hypothetical protein